MNEKEAREFDHLFQVSKDFEAHETLPEKTARARGYLEAIDKARGLEGALNKIINQRIDGFDWPLHCQVAKEALAEWEKVK